jgi:hypothetical protein
MPPLAGNLHIRSGDAFDGTVRAFIIDVLRQWAVSPVSKESFRPIKHLDGRTSGSLSTNWRGRAMSVIPSEADIRTAGVYEYTS